MTKGLDKKLRTIKDFLDKNNHGIAIIGDLSKSKSNYLNQIVCKNQQYCQIFHWVFRIRPRIRARSKSRHCAGFGNPFGRRSGDREINIAFANCPEFGSGRQKNPVRYGGGV